MTSEMADGVLQRLEGDYLVKVKFVREQAPDVWVVEDGFAPLEEGKAHGGGVIEVSSLAKAEWHLGWLALSFLDKPEIAI